MSSSNTCCSKRVLQGGLCVRVVEPQKSCMLPLARSLLMSVASDVLDDDAVEESLARLRPQAVCCSSTSHGGFEECLFPRSQGDGNPEKQEVAPRQCSFSPHRAADQRRVLRRLRYKGLSQACVNRWKGFT